MAGDLAAFTLLGDSADWLKDTGGVSIREYRLAAIDAYRAAWASPTSNTRFATLQAVFGRLFDALRHNQLYPEAVILSGTGDKTARYLAAPESLRKDFELLRNFCVVNKFGMGEIHLLHIALLFCRTLYQGEAGLRDEVLEEEVDNVLFLRLPIYRADNLGEFSTEVKARFHAVRIMYSMKRLGLFDDSVVHTISAQDQAEARKLLANKLSADVERTPEAAPPGLPGARRGHRAGGVHPRPYRRPRSAGERTPEEIFLRLRHRLRHLHGHAEVTAAMQADSSTSASRRCLSVAARGRRARPQHVRFPPRRQERLDRAARPHVRGAATTPNGFVSSTSSSCGGSRTPSTTYSDSSDSSLGGSCASSARRSASRSSPRPRLRPGRRPTDPRA